MDLQPESLSPDTAAIADANLDTNGTLTEVTPTSIPAAYQQNSSFLRLPLELRFMIYDHALDYEPGLPLGYLPIDYPETLEAVAQLSGISRQIRDEVHAWVADQICIIHLSTAQGRRLLPLSASSKYFTAFMEGPVEWEDFYLRAPRDIKFWKSSMFFFAWSSGLVSFEIDFRRREVFVEGRKVDMSRYGPYRSSFYGPSQSSINAEDLSHKALQTSVNSLTKSMQTVVDQAGFDGFTLEDMHSLLRDLKLSVPEPSGDVHLEYDDPDAKSIETGGD
ncbi:hypothetical protein M436DRAFT_82767 [Aureobasidium namibiae CBS 147.97]|uniref:F-box domain-containing protein n=1 Tax=Aureobasidium namibiae CBS 147.97 TaxID=1043004 RepID=A0A074WHV5_9PEZI